MTIYKGYLWELKKSYHTGWIKFKVKSIKFLDFSSYNINWNDASTIFIIEPIKNVDEYSRRYVIKNLDSLKDSFIIHYEADEWILKLP